MFKLIGVASSDPHPSFLLKWGFITGLFVLTLIIRMELLEENTIKFFILISLDFLLIFNSRRLLVVPVFLISCLTTIKNLIHCLKSLSFWIIQHLTRVQSLSPAIKWSYQKMLHLMTTYSLHWTFFYQKYKQVSSSASPFSSSIPVDPPPDNNIESGYSSQTTELVPSVLRSETSSMPKSTSNTKSDTVISQPQPYPINSHPVQNRSRSGLLKNRLHSCLSNTF